jgi:hypothetical protein
VRPTYLTLLANLGQIGQAEEARRVKAEALDRFSAGFRARLLSNPPNTAEDREHFIEG